MASRNFAKSLDAVLKHEGGYVNHPRDPGGPTNMGITLRTLAAWRKTSVTASDVQNLSKEEAAKIYRKQYWDAVRGDDLPAGLDYVMFDYAVNSGAGKAIRDLQSVLNVTRDGQIGAMTLDAAARAGVGATINGVMDTRLAFLKRLRTWDAFGKGWTRRINEVRATGLRMRAPNAAQAPEPDVAPTPGKARVDDVRPITTTEGKATTIAAAGAIGQMLTEAANKIQPLGSVSTWFHVIFAVLIIGGVVLGAMALIKRQKDGGME
jgi:lysozyme family protein